MNTEVRSNFDGEKIIRKIQCTSAALETCHLTTPVDGSQITAVSHSSPPPVSIDNASAASQQDRNTVSATIVDFIKRQFLQYRLRQQIMRERETLSSLPDHLLHDIGVSRGDAEAEASRRFNDIPSARLSEPTPYYPSEGLERPKAVEIPKQPESVQEWHGAKAA